MKTQIETADLEGQPAGYERDAIDVLLDVGSTFDWITPTYEAVRNLVEDGASFCLLSYDWHDVKWELQSRRIPYWGESVHWIDGAYWTTFSVHSENAWIVRQLTVCRSNGGRGKAIFMLLVLAAVLGGGFLLAAALAAAMPALLTRQQQIDQLRAALDYIEAQEYTRFEWETMQQEANYWENRR